jgi:DNA-binding transcriptional MerR regulator
MRIGKLAKATETTARALRYYEEQGLITSGRDSLAARLLDM